LSQTEVLANTQKSHKGFFKVKAILEQWNWITKPSYKQDSG
jgi:hypothetical protein